MTVRSLEWEETLGADVTLEWERRRDGVEIEFGNFEFDYAGRRWNSVVMSKHGLLAFGAPLEYSIHFAAWFSPMSESAARLADSPTISALYKPAFGGLYGRDPLASQFVARFPDRVVFTWFASEYDAYRLDVPDHAERFQAVLYADGAIRFNYGRITVRDGVVGLFSDAIEKGDLIASVADAADPDLPGHLDLLEAALYETNTDALMIEWTLRDDIPVPPSGTTYSYRLYFDTDAPYFDGGEFDFMWSVDVATDGQLDARGPASAERRPEPDCHGGGQRGRFRDHGKRQARRRSIRRRVLRSGKPGRPAEVDHAAERKAEDGSVTVRWSVLQPAERGLPSSGPAGHGGDRLPHHREPGRPVRPVRLPQRVPRRLPDERYRLAELPQWRGGNRARGYVAGSAVRRRAADGPLRASRRRIRHAGGRGRDWRNGNFKADLALFAHEFTHSWTAYLSYVEGNGARGRLFADSFADGCRCHWRGELHAPAAFPWGGEQAHSLMMGGEGGGFWRDNGDGTFTVTHFRDASGLSWLDLYAMGLAEASEVPDLFVLRHLEPVAGNDSPRSSGQYRGNVSRREGNHLDRSDRGGHGAEGASGCTLTEGVQHRIRLLAGTGANTHP